ncbi:tellurite resistance protein TerA [Filimonas lacunae]|uniref:Tellurite resistance protein TerA n=1 Tax=Filimonas lacunae TaxID=477680 RepID=A0A173MEU2_9BACT|nr:stress protein [Filimonas lacunae]BAV05951.1 tellurium resistance protein TerA [Filimonas lacunae]SIT23885.1 tellurite resistance protein TerA [Filimonas lacunae]
MAISLQKITLEKKGDLHMIDLTKKTDPITQEININLNWSKTTKKGFLGGLFSSDTDIDLDLGCFYELSDGTKNVIDGVQFAKGNGGSKEISTRQGRYTAAPWVWHTGDDRGVAAGSGENIIVNPKGIGELKRIVIYCFIYNGVARWQETNATVTVKVPGKAEIEVQMGKQTSSEPFCAIAEIQFTPDSMGVRKLVTFHPNHSHCDAAYHWGMRWQAGSK